MPRSAHTTALPILFFMSCLLLFQGLLLSCDRPVTSNGVPIDNPALAAAARSVDVAEVAMVVITDGLTAAYEAGRVPRSVLEQYDQQVVPRVKATFAVARIALTTWAQAPAQAAPTTVASALRAVQQELSTLLGFYAAHAPAKGATP